MRPQRPVAGDWLGLRRQADARARESSTVVVRELRRRLASATGPVSVVDVGAGTGANQAWLVPRLGDPDAAHPGVAQRWTLLDHDPGLLEAVTAVRHPRLVSTRWLQGDVESVADVLAALPAPRLVTCSAVLDLLTRDQVHQLCTACVATGSPALLALSVTGVVSVQPGHPDDAPVAEAFNAHQQRAEPGTGAALLGPRGWEVAAAAFAAAGWRVRTALTPWDLGPELAPMAQRYLRDRAAAVREQATATAPDPPLAAAVDRWLAERLEALEAGILRVRVEHRDLLALPVR